MRKFWFILLITPDWNLHFYMDARPHAWHLGCAYSKQNCIHNRRLRSHPKSKHFDPSNKTPSKIRHWTMRHILLHSHVLFNKKIYYFDRIGYFICYLLPSRLPTISKESVFFFQTVIEVSKLALACWIKKWVQLG